MVSGKKQYIHAPCDHIDAEATCVPGLDGLVMTLMGHSNASSVVCPRVGGQIIPNLQGQGMRSARGNTFTIMTQRGDPIFANRD